MDYLYRFDQGKVALNTESKGFLTDIDRGDAVQRVFGTPDGRRAAWLRYPARKTTIIILTNDDRFFAKAAAQRIADRLFAR